MADEPLDRLVCLVIEPGLRNCPNIRFEPVE